MDNILSTEKSTISSQDLPKYGYIYITTNLINNKKYIGMHKSNCKENMSENHANVFGNKNPFYGKHHLEESRKRISQNNGKAHLGKVWITNKIDNEILIKYNDLYKYPNYVRGRLRKSQRNNLGR